MLWLITTVLLTQPSAPASAAPPTLDTLAPEQRAAFDDAKKAEKDGRLTEAEAGFWKVLTAVPEFADGRRHLCITLLAEGRAADAVVQCDRAVMNEKSFENERWQMSAKLERGGRGDESAVEAWIARTLPQQTHGSANWIVVKSIECQLRMAEESLAAADKCGSELLEVLPDDPLANYLSIRATREVPGKLERLDKARPILPPAEFERIRRSIEASRPNSGSDDTGSPWLFGVLGFGIWLAMFGALVAVGLLLSALTLRLAARLSTARDQHASREAKVLRAIYRNVVAWGAVFYYLSLPLLLVATLVTLGAMIYAAFLARTFPLQLLVVVVTVGVTTVFAIVRSVFVRVPDDDPGEKLDWSKAARLRALLDQVASTIGTRPVDTVYLTPDTEIAVFERGSLRRKWAGNAERCLILGVGALDGLRVGPFRSVLAHEYGHFSNEDTAGGALALWARRSLIDLGTTLARERAATPFNPAWWFFRVYSAVYIRISQGASRLQEVLADRRAIFAYGSQAFLDGYTHVLRRQVAFELHVASTLGELVKTGGGLPNLYRFKPAQAPAATELEQLFQKAIERTPTAYDSHPIPAQRMVWAAELSVTGRDDAGADERVWDLFDARDEIEQLMTRVVRSDFAVAQGYVIPAESVSPGEPDPADASIRSAP